MVRQALMYLVTAWALFSQALSQDLDAEELKKLAYDSTIKSLLMFDNKDENEKQLPVYGSKNEATSRDNLFDTPLYIGRQLPRGGYLDIDQIPTSRAMAPDYATRASKYIRNHLPKSADNIDDDDMYYREDNRMSSAEDFMKRGMSRDENVMKRGLARCIVNCLKGKRRRMMNFIQCKSMCH